MRLVLVLTLALAALASAEPLVITPLAEKRVAALPAGTLVWRIETYASKAEAEAAAGEWVARRRKCRDGSALHARAMSGGPSPASSVACSGSGTDSARRRDDVPAAHQRRERTAG